MSDLPPGQWSSLLVGHQWPVRDSFSTLALAATHRRAVGTEFDAYSDLLQSARRGALASQVGVTADDVQDAFRTGEMRAHAIADKQRAISNSYEEAHKSVAILRSQLSDIARRGNAEIRQIQASKDPAVSKVAKIVETVIRSQTDANLQAAICSDGVFGAIQRILDTDVADTSAREFANSIGLNLDHAFRSSKVEDVRAQVTQALDNPLLQTTTEESATGPSRYSTGTVPSGSDAMHIADAPTRAGDFESRLSTGGITPRPLETPSPSAPISSDSRYETGETSGMGTYGAPPAMHSSPAPATRTTTVGGVLPQPTSTPHSPTTNIPTPAPALSPEGLANNFNSGVHAGAPVSTGAEALSNNFRFGKCCNADSAMARMEI